MVFYKLTCALNIIFNIIFQVHKVQKSFFFKGFIGVEYFFAAKSSLSAEFGWGPQLQTRSRSKVETESWNGSSAASESQDGGKSSTFMFDNDNAGGSLNLNFYF